MKKIYLILITFLFGISTVFAVNTTPRTEEDLGVNKRWKINNNNKQNVLNTPRVDASEKIYDFANILENTEELYKEIQKYNESTSMDLVILTTDLSLDDSGLEDYAADFYDYNDFGINYEHYSGTILIINMNTYNRFFNIHTFGNAQLYYEYGTCEKILDSIYDFIKDGKYERAFSTYVNNLKKYYDNYEPNGATIDKDGKYIPAPQKFYVPWPFAIFGAILTTLISMIVMVNKNKLVKKATEANEYLNKGSIKYGKMNDIFLYSRTTSHTVSTSSGGGGSSGGYSHSGSSGGYHGGGGGRHF